MALEVNPHVKRLRRFQPFQPDSAELVYEQSDPREKRYETVALGYLALLVEEPGVKMIVLTGDAGHGKTSLCAKLLERFGMDADTAAEAIRAQGDGAGPVTTSESGRPLWLLKDLSDITVDRAAALLGTLMDLPDPSVSIVCANEGRLRNAVARNGSHGVTAITRTLEQGIRDGSVSDPTGSVQVINLNYQSVAPEGRQGLVDWAVRTWGADRRSWQACNRCDARAICPVLANHRQLSDETRGQERRSAIRTLFSTAERAGAVVTTRQALAIIAYTISGGLTCQDVHARWQRARQDRSWQYPHLYHQAIFADLLSKEKRRQVPALLTLRRLDPGSVAQRAVDDYLEPSPESAEFLPPVPTIDDGTPPTRRAAQRESNTLRGLMVFLRRQDFFDSSDGLSRMVRMGLPEGADFERVTQSGEHGQTRTRDRLLRGLEAVQGVHRLGEPPDFYVLDPAFLAHRSRAAVVARRLPNRRVIVVSQIDHWRATGGGIPELPQALDWLSRLAFLQISADRDVVSVPLDLVRFELLHRWAAGLSSRSQHESEIRSLSSALAQLAPAKDEPDEITVLVGGERRSLTIDVGDRIRSGDA